MPGGTGSFLYPPDIKHKISCYQIQQHAIIRDYESASGALYRNQFREILLIKQFLLTPILKEQLMSRRNQFDILTGMLPLKNIPCGIFIMPTF